MKILIVYYSYSHGNTKKIAEALAKATEGISSASRRSGNMVLMQKPSKWGRQKYSGGGVSAATADEEGYRGI